MTKNDTRQCLINFIQENTYTFDEVQFSVPVPTFYAWVSYGLPVGVLVSRLPPRSFGSFFQVLGGIFRYVICQHVAEFSLI